MPTHIFGKREKFILKVWIVFFFASLDKNEKLSFILGTDLST